MSIRGILAASVAAILVGCASDNVHQPKPELRPENLAYAGELESSIPLFPDFGPLLNADSLSVEWDNSTRTRASLHLGEFTLYVDVVDLQITIGQMDIENVAFVWDAEGGATLMQPDFECQAGAYHTLGSLTGTLHSDGNIDVSLDYKPGAMPFMVHSQFTALK